MRKELGERRQHPGRLQGDRGLGHPPGLGSVRHSPQSWNLTVSTPQRRPQDNKRVGVGAIPTSRHVREQGFEGRYSVAPH